MPRSTGERARFPFIDVHNHQRPSMTPDELAPLVAEMDRINMRLMVNLNFGMTL